MAPAGADPRVWPAGDGRSSRATLWPRWWRLLLACLIAPMPPAVLLAGGLQMLAQEPHIDPPHLWSEAMLLLFMGGYPCEILIGAPVCIVLRRAGPTLALFWLVGIGVTAIPWLFAALTQPHIVGFRASSLAAAFGLGTIGGLTFWLIAVWRDPRFRRILVT